MKHIFLAILCLLTSMAAMGAGSSPTTPSKTIDDSYLLFRPSKAAMVFAYQASGLVRPTGSVLIAYDEKGNVLGVKLEKSTGSSSLDKELVAWAAQVKLKVTSSGTALLPFTFSPY
jgi:uncharacterized protein YuzE